YCGLPHAGEAPSMPPHCSAPSSTSSARARATPGCIPVWTVHLDSSLCAPIIKFLLEQLHDLVILLLLLGVLLVPTPERSSDEIHYFSADGHKQRAEPSESKMDRSPDAADRPYDTCVQISTHVFIFTQQVLDVEEHVCEIVLDESHSSFLSRAYLH